MDTKKWTGYALWANDRLRGQALDSDSNEFIITWVYYRISNEKEISQKYE